MSVFLFGSLNNVGTDDFLGAGNAGTCLYTYSGPDAIIEEIHIILRTNTMTSGSLKLGLYDDAAAVPVNLLGQNTVPGSPNVAGEYVISGLAIPIINGDARHIACVGSGGQLTFTGPAGTYREKSSAAGSFPNPYGGTGSSALGSLLIPMWAAGSIGSPPVIPSPLRFSRRVPLRNGNEA